MEFGLKNVKKLKISLVMNEKIRYRRFAKGQKKLKQKEDNIW